MKTKKAMKKITNIGMAALVAMGMLGTSCNKAESPEIETPETQKENIVTLTTTVGFAADGTKALTSTGVKTFAVGETMAIYYWKNKGNDHVKAVSAPLTAGDITNGGKSATFTFTLDNPYKDMSVSYVYPAAMANADFTPNYDALYNNQDGTLATLASNFDFCTRSGAWSGGNLPSLTLVNQLAILAITLKNADGSSDITSSITGLTLSDGTNTYAITRSAAAGPIYVAIQPTSSAAISVIATDGTNNYRKSLSGKTYAANNGYSVSWKMILTGAFTIKNSGTQVKFAPGNLQATWDGTSWTWAFAANQWDYIGNAAGNTKVKDSSPFISENATVDLFGWVGASSDWTGAAQYGITSSTTTNNTDGYGNNASEALKSDWGTLMGDGWRTLTSDEWQYLFNTRTSGSTVNGTSNARYTHATINTDGTGVNGMILFPDGITVANSEATSWGTVNGTSAWGTICTTAQWAALAAKGCVFLPAAGYRDQASVSGAGSLGYYWSSSPYTSGVNYAYNVSFNSVSLSPASRVNRRYGRSVRLVRQVE